MKKLLFLLILTIFTFQSDMQGISAATGSDSKNSAIKSKNTNPKKPIQTQTSTIKITNSLNNRERAISDAKELNRFHYFWSQKQPVKNNKAIQWRYQILISERGKKSRWVYDPKGYAREISLKKSNVIYRLTPIRSFNRFILQE